MPSTGYPRDKWLLKTLVAECILSSCMNAFSSFLSRLRAAFLTVGTVI